VGDLTETHISDEFPSQPCLFAVELAESGEVQVLGDLELAGLEQEEGGDQMWVAADDAELAAELLFPAGHVTPTPSPHPVRERAVETVPNHEDVGCSEHQIRLSKGVIAKFVQSLESGSAIQAGAPAARAAGFAPLSLTPGCVGDPTPILYK
jgi:hypothetical protein